MIRVQPEPDNLWEDFRDTLAEADGYGDGDAHGDMNGGNCFASKTVGIGVGAGGLGGQQFNHTKHTECPR